MALHGVRFCWQQFALLATMLLAIQAEAFAKEKVPEAAALKKSQELVEELFAEELAEAKTSAAKTGLAKELIRQAVDTQDDPAGRYALLQAAGKLAIEAVDAETALAAVDRMGESFELDALTMKFKVLRAVARKAKLSTQSKVVAQQALKLLDQAVEADDLSMAVELGKLGARAARKARQQTLAKQLAARTKQAEKLAKSHAEYEQVMAALDKNPGDPTANLAAGRYLCLVKGDWEKGVSYLALGNDPELKQLAIKELNGVGNPKAQVALADAWWNLAQTREGRDKHALMLRAGSWYEHAQTELASGLLRVKVTKRLDKIAAIGQPIPEATKKQPPLAVAPFDSKQAAGYQFRWSKHLRVPGTLTNSIGMKFVFIPPGEFEMGSDKEEIDRLLEEVKQRKLAAWHFSTVPSEGPQHRIRISRPFYLGVFEVTQAEYQRLMGANPSFYKTADLRGPVGSTSWNDARKFCQRLCDLPKEKIAGRVYRLPSEAEWEYACRAGTTTRYYFGQDDTHMDDYAWSRRNTLGSTRPVGLKRPNAWGLYDMHGNVWEYCADRFGLHYYGQSPPNDPTGPTSGGGTVSRGGGTFEADPIFYRSAYRLQRSEESRNASDGFRVALTIEPK